MEYKLNITNSYGYLIGFFDSIGIDFYMSFPVLDSNEKCTVFFENIAINMDEERWREPILRVNPNSIINLADDMVILLKRARLTINNTKSIDIALDRVKFEVFNSSGLSFDFKDKYIWCAGQSMDYIKTQIYSYIIFSGNMYLEFDEEDISIFVINYDVQISDIEQIKRINQASQKKSSLK